MKNNMLKNNWKSLLGVIALAGLMLHASGACHRKVGTDPVEAPPGHPLPGDAKTARAERGAMSARVDLVGTAASDRLVKLSARLAAYVQEVRATAGDRVKTGDLLVALDDREIREQLTAAEAQLRQAESEYKRTKQLFEAKAATEQAMTAAESGFQSARAQVDRMRVMLSYAQVTAPMEGVVTERRVEVGDLANPGQMLLSVYDPARMRLEVPVPVRLLHRFAVGQQVQVRLDYPARVTPGQVTEIVSEIDPRSRTRKVKILLDDSTGDILPGAFGRVWVDDTEHDGVWVPAAAVIRNGQLESVQVVQGDRVVSRLVRTRALDESRLEILSGLQGGETVLLSAPGK
jgi:membrane fusion protein (multidrug efflux system)